MGVVTTGVASNHPARIRIIAHLSILPGDHFRSIVRLLGLGIGNTRHHLNVLQDNGLLRVERHGGKIRYYLSGAGSDGERNELFAKHWSYRDLRLRILYATTSQGESTPGSIAAALGISRQLAAYHLASLVDLGLLKKEGRRYHP